MPDSWTLISQYMSGLIFDRLIKVQKTSVLCLPYIAKYLKNVPKFHKLAFQDKNEKFRESIFSREKTMK